MNKLELKKQVKVNFDIFCTLHLRKIRKERPYYTKASARKNVIEWLCSQLNITPQNFKDSLSDINTCKRILEIFKKH